MSLFFILGSITCATAFNFDNVYAAFRQKHGRQDIDTNEYEQRLKLFTQRHAYVEAQNSKPNALWRAEVNKFADHTDEEFRVMLGYRGSSNRLSGGQGASSGSSFLQVKPGKVFGEAKDWQKALNTSKFLREQGSCGSCWAVAAIGATEMHAEAATGKQVPKLSFKQLVDCVANPRHCGGEGGCKGATAELAFKFMKTQGVTVESEYEDEDRDGQCKKVKAPALKPHDFVTLPVNKQDPLLEVLYSKGPVVVSVDASTWSAYADGVFDGCERDATVNHAVLVVGYGRDRKLKKDYYNIRNSWGSDWGENGFIRLLRFGSDTGEKGWCGTDYNPKAGVGCDGGPATLPVCGMCGVLSDSSYPVMSA
mmetsp:Transcript_28387/g.51245  ORF Transcript_28387/g.51245 Transcript_28387/m.51245 type:complete len:365 (+) Transcript_28387:176-1270(+)